MSSMLRAVALTGLLALVSCQKAQPTTQTVAPPEPYKMVYTEASPTEVTLLDLNSVTKVGDVAEVWSLTFLAEPVRLEGAPMKTQVFWKKARLDCAGETGQSVEAIGLENGRAIFTIPVKEEATALATAWSLEKEFVCDDLQGARTAATTFVEAITAARNAMTPPATPAPASGDAMTPLVPGAE